MTLIYIYMNVLSLICFACGGLLIRSSMRGEVLIWISYCYEKSILTKAINDAMFTLQFVLKVISSQIYINVLYYLRKIFKEYNLLYLPGCCIFFYRSVKTFKLFSFPIFWLQAYMHEGGYSRNARCTLTYYKLHVGVIWNQRLIDLGFFFM